MIAQNMNEPTLWTIVIALAVVVSGMARAMFLEFTECKRDRKVLHKKTAKLGNMYAAKFGEVVDLDDVGEQ